ncbi:MAG: SUMF1/EgtB/PvdO family nonheme iron enzyme [Deltaproteobacteria bacterium]|nr:SUMF1/EgtB/PvdO family nonheme iron enzyme [Deltaproteobacteria bacterium]
MIATTLLLACTGDAPIEARTASGEAVPGMVEVPGGRVKLGMPQPPGAPPGPPPGHSPGQAGGAANPAVANGAMPLPLPEREVEVSSFLVDVTEVTRVDYAAFLEGTGYRPPYVAEAWADEGWNWTGRTYPEGTGDHPVVLVNWYDARAYCHWAGKRLPTGAEWQLAALGPAAEGRAWPWGTTYERGRLNHGKNDVPNFDDSDGYERTSPVGAFPAGASPYGLQDAFGNAWEWVADIRVSDWADTTAGAGEGLASNPRTGTLGLYAGARGGSYFSGFEGGALAQDNAFPVQLRRKSSGFRCARDL